jgi:NADH dehydrogenase FAD-containing subunit
MKDVLAPDEDRMTKRLLFLRLSKKGVSIYLNCGVEYITAGAVAANTVLGPKTFPAEKVVLAAGYTSVSDLVWNCDLGERETYIIGDANAKHPAGFLEAVSDGFVVGRRV